MDGRKGQFVSKPEEGMDAAAKIAVPLHSFPAPMQLHSYSGDR